MLSSVWLDLFIRSGILLLAGEALKRVLARASAADRYKLLLCIFAFLLVLPVSCALLPFARIPLLFSQFGDASVSIRTTVLSRVLTPNDALASRREEWLLLVWFVGLLVALASLICGRFILWRVARRARPVSDTASKELLHQFCSKLGIENEPELLQLPGLPMPLTFGIRRCRILLPTGSSTWSPLRKRVVLLHELAHIARRDIAAQLFAGLVAALWWFQPLVWLTRRALRQESEQACDAQAVAAGIRPSDYAAELIDIARSAGSASLWSRAAIAMARPRDLEGRLLRILHPPASTYVPKRSAAIALLAAIAITASAVTLSSSERVPHLGGLFMKKTLISGLVASASLTAATITGSVFDSSGTPIGDAKVSISEPDTSLKQDTTSTANGKFSFDGLPAGQYILRIEKPGYSALLREFTLEQSSNVERGFSMQLPPSQKDLQVNGKDAEALPYTGEPKRLRVGGSYMQSQLVNKVNPVYPVPAKAARIQGTVLLDTVVLKDGSAGEISVTSSPNDDLSQASLEAVRQWRWKPVLLNGQPIEVVTEVLINYTLVR